MKLLETVGKCKKRETSGFRRQIGMKKPGQTDLIFRRLCLRTLSVILSKEEGESWEGGGVRGGQCVCGCESKQMRIRTSYTTSSTCIGRPLKPRSQNAKVVWFNTSNRVAEVLHKPCTTFARDGN